MTEFGIVDQVPTFSCTTCQDQRVLITYPGILPVETYFLYLMLVLIISLILLERRVVMFLIILNVFKIWKGDGGVGGESYTELYQPTER